MRERVQAPGHTVTVPEAQDVLLCVASLFLLVCASPRRARLVSLYKVVLDNSREARRLLRQSKMPGDAAIEEDLRRYYPVKDVRDDPGDRVTVDVVYESIRPFFEKVKSLEKKQWVSALVERSSSVDPLCPSFSESIRALCPLWYGKTDQCVYTHGVALATAYVERERRREKGECEEKEKERERRREDFGVLRVPENVKYFEKVFEFVIDRWVTSSSPEIPIGSELKKFFQILQSSNYGLLDWNAFVNERGVGIPDVVFDKHTGAKGRDTAHFALVSSVIPNQEIFLSEPQNILLRAYARCHILRDSGKSDICSMSSPTPSSSSLPVAGAKRKREEEGGGQDEGDASKRDKADLPASLKAPLHYQKVPLPPACLDAVEREIKILPQSAIDEMEHCPRGQRATGSHKGVVYIFRQWCDSKYVLKSVKSLDIAAIVSMRTRVISDLWGGSVSRVHCVYRRESDGRLFLCFGNVADPELSSKVSISASFQMLNEGNEMRDVVNKRSQGLQEFHHFLQSLSPKEVTVKSNCEAAAKVVLGFLYRKLLGVGDPTLRNALIRLTDRQSFVIDFEETTTEKSISLRGSLSMMTIGQRCGKDSAEKLDRMCRCEKSMMMKEVENAMKSIEDGRFLRTVEEFGFPSTYFDVNFMMTLCRAFTRCLRAL